MTSNDLIVIIPGIAGSTLTRGGTDLWALDKPAMLLTALATLGANIRKLELPNGIGDQAPDDGVHATSLMSKLHFIPGLWPPMHGYDKLVQRLRATHTDIPWEIRHLNPVLFPYDWRLSNRYTGRLLKVQAESALSRWRDSAPQNSDAKIVFVCHSMGGLIARWYISKEGGAPLTRKMITLGTPYRGALKALSVLADGPIPKLRLFGERLHPAVLSFPSIHQLLPSYACIDHGGGDLEYLAEQTDSALSSAARSDAALFYRELEEAESLDAGTAARRHAIVGTRQSTSASASMSNGRYVLSNHLARRDLGGDGTVSAASGPKGIPLDDNSIRRVADQHGHLQCNNAALDEVESVLTSDSIVVKATAAQDLSVTVPEILSVGEAVTATIESFDGRRSVRIALRDERGSLIADELKVLRSSTIEYRTSPLGPGGYSLAVRDAKDGTSGVNSSFLVWPD